MVTSSVLDSRRASGTGKVLLLVFLGFAAGLPAAGATPARAAVAPHSVASNEVLVHYRGEPGEQRVSVSGGNSVAGTLSELRSDPAVSYARPDYLVHAARSWPDDPGPGGRGHWYRDQWNFLSPLDVAGGIGMPSSWQRLIADGHPGGKGVTVAVLDTGVAYRNHGHRFRRDPDLPKVRHFVHPKDFVDGDRLPLDREGHGTHVASTIAQATNNGLGLTGIAYRAKVMPIRVLNQHEVGKGSDLAKGIDFATAHGADVINLSLNFKPDVKHCEQIVALCHAIQHAIHKGVTVVGAAGNDDMSRVSYPAAAKGVIAVGASTYRGCDADYSNFGADLDLVAPGGGGDKAPGATADRRCRPNAQGYEIRQYSLLPRATKHGNFRKFGIVGMDGTSMSAAHVSGVAATVISSHICGKHPRPRRVARRIKRTTIDRGVPGRDDVYGDGLLNASKAISPAAPCGS